MGLGERFKQTIENLDIYSLKKEAITTKKVTVPIKAEAPSTDNYTEMKNLLLAKINKIPCWDAYTRPEKVTMLGKYFDVKTARTGLKNTDNETKKTFIENVLAAAGGYDTI